MFDSFKNYLSSFDMYYVITIMVLVFVFIYILYELFHVKTYHFYQNNLVESFVNISDKKNVSRADIESKVLEVIRKENNEVMDPYLQMGTKKSTYKDIVLELNDLSTKHMIFLISNLKGMNNGYHSYNAMHRCYMLREFKKSLAVILDNLND
tara:strand:- start:2041 stop:2496 length:456 start_codon:yes stop_codon:yes gene_type:complete